VSTHKGLQNSPAVGGKIWIHKQSPPIKDNKTHRLVEEKFESLKQCPNIKANKTHPLLKEKFGSVSRVHASKATKLTRCGRKKSDR
jgi:hypothetical protein